MKKLLLLSAVCSMLVCSLLLASCTNPKGARKTLDGAGFSNVQITGYKWFACSKDDFYHTGFKAVGPTGKTVEGCVCEGLFIKNSTIRYK